MPSLCVGPLLTRPPRMGIRGYIWHMYSKSPHSSLPSMRSGAINTIITTIAYVADF